ncbi:MAG: sodium:solute symporter [Victivallales bacterium]|nr:sodium:solute symporter [Victivallales bacterium]
MNWCDWIIIAIYALGLIAFSIYLGKTQQNQCDYYLGGNRMSFWAIGISTMATQCSSNSLLGAPAFVIAVGGLTWLQYELAVPLAMAGTILFLMPFFRRLRLVSVYEYLERRFGPGTRTILSLTFQFLRAFATGVTVYGISLVVQQITGLSFTVCALFLCAVTVIYDFLGGMKAVVYSDVIQMVILYVGIIICAVYGIYLCGGIGEVFRHFPADKMSALVWSRTGLGDYAGGGFAFLPMFCGGLFLYMSYYGCDQTQAQRALSARSVDEANATLMVNGLLRFPLVLSYCLVGVIIGAYLIKFPEFTTHLRDAAGQVNYNLALPVFVLKKFPHGLIGIVIAALFAAAMSSLDSTINSLSAVSMRDVYERFFERNSHSPRLRLLLSRLTTLFWGTVCTTAAFFVADISGSIIESINKIGSLLYGPILAVFLLGILTRKANGIGATTGLLTGFAANAGLWLFAPAINWMWWNVAGCLITFGSGYLLSMAAGKTPSAAELDLLTFRGFAAANATQRKWLRNCLYLSAYTFFIILVCYLIGRLPEWFGTGSGR